MCNDVIEQGEGGTMLLAMWFHTIPLPSVHCATWVQQRHVNCSPVHRVAQLLHRTGSIATLTKYLGTRFREAWISFVRPKSLIDINYIK